MVKRIVLVIVVLAGALLAYNYFTTGNLTLIPGASISAEEQELNDLEAQLKQEVRQFAQAGRAAGLSGVDTTADAEAARVAIEKIGKRLDAMASKASANLKDKLRKVQDEMREAKQSLGIR